MVRYGIVEYSLRVLLWALVMGPFDSGGVCSMGPYFLYGTWLACVGVQIWYGAHRNTIGMTSGLLP